MSEPTEQVSDQFTCHTCGWTWIRGQSGSHSCTPRLVAGIAAKDAEIASLRKERDEFQAELQKVCDHDWQHIDDSFDHEFGTEQLHSCLCEKCGATKPYEPETFGDEAI